MNITNIHDEDEYIYNDCDVIYGNIEKALIIIFPSH